MTDKQYRALIFRKRTLQFFLGIHIQMIGRLIQKKQIGFPVYQFTQSDLCLLTTAQHFHFTFNVLCRQPAFCQRTADFILGIAQKGFPDFLDTMRENIAGALGIELFQVNVKATTEEGLGFTGAMEGISSQAICMLQRPSERYEQQAAYGDCGGCGGCPRR